jgi:hypothetical protein
MHSRFVDNLALLGTCTFEPKLAQEPVGGSAEEFTRFVEAASAQFAGLVKELGHQLGVMIALHKISP